MSPPLDIFPFEPFWGNPTSSIDWCEPNYQTSRFIAEPLNTVSNLSFVVFGILGALHEAFQGSKKCYVLMYATVSAIGVGSMLFHGTLTVWGQQLDELPMVWHLLSCFYIINRDSAWFQKTLSSPSTSSTAISTSASSSHPPSNSNSNSNQPTTLLSSTPNPIVLPPPNNWLPALLVAYAIVFSVVHMKLQSTTAFQVHFLALVIGVLARLFQRFRFTEVGKEGRRVIFLFFASGIAAFACWLADYHGCEWIQRNLPFNPQGHVFWHLLMGYSAYVSVVMVKILDYAERGKRLHIKYNFGLPFASREPNVREEGDERESGYHNSNKDIESNSRGGGPCPRIKELF